MRQAPNRKKHFLLLPNVNGYLITPGKPPFSPWFSPFRIALRRSDGDVWCVERPDGRWNVNTNAGTKTCRTTQAAAEAFCEAARLDSSLLGPKKKQMLPFLFALLAMQFTRPLRRKHERSMDPRRSLASQASRHPNRRQQSSTTFSFTSQRTRIKRSRPWAVSRWMQLSKARDCCRITIGCSQLSILQRSCCWLAVSLIPVASSTQRRYRQFSVTAMARNRNEPSGGTDIAS